MLRAPSQVDQTQQSNSKTQNFTDDNSYKDSLQS